MSPTEEIRWRIRIQRRFEEIGKLSPVDAAAATQALISGEGIEDYESPEEAADEEMSYWTCDEGSVV